MTPRRDDERKRANELLNAMPRSQELTTGYRSGFHDGFSAGEKSGYLRGLEHAFEVSAQFARISDFRAVLIEGIREERETNEGK